MRVEEVEGGLRQIRLSVTSLTGSSSTSLKKVTDAKTANVPLPIGSEKVNPLCKDPLVVGEVTVSMRSTDDSEKKFVMLLEAEKLLRSSTKGKHYVKVLAFENAPEEIVEYLREESWE